MYSDMVIVLLMWVCAKLLQSTMMPAIQGSLLLLRLSVSQHTTSFEVLKFSAAGLFVTGCCVVLGRHDQHSGEMASAQMGSCVAGSCVHHTPPA